MTDIETIKTIGVCISILSNMGVFAVVGFFFKRLIINLDNKAEKSTVERLETRLNDNFELDRVRDEKLNNLISSINILIQQVTALAKVTDGKECSVRGIKINTLENRIEEHEKRISKLEQ